MIASNEQLNKVQAILQQLDYAQAHGGDDNRRRAARVNVRMPMAAVILGGVNPAPVQIYSRNLSVSGIGFVSRRMFKREERVVIRLNVNNLAKKLILARVTFARYVTGGIYEVGAEFLECVQDKGQNIPSHWLLTGLPKGKSPAKVAT